MPYLPHTQRDVEEMLTAIGAKSTNDLFADVPPELLLPKPIDQGSMNEFELMKFFECAADQNLTVEPGKMFVGAGAYNHYIPAAVRNLIQRGEFVTCYTPYQAEVSQGTLQAIYEFQSHICALTAMDVANASMYDGATALAEALTMAVRHTGRNLVLLPETLHPSYRAVCETFLREIGVAIQVLPEKEGRCSYEVEGEGLEAAAVVVQTPNFLGILEETAEARALADRTKALLVAACNPTALALIEPPGEFGADIAVGEAQPLGIPLQYGGPYAGYFACKQELIRKMPGRIAGLTTDDAGRQGFVLTLQTREQHIRRERATSNICTNQGLFALMVTMYLTFVGKQGLVEVAETCVARTHELAERVVAETEAVYAYPHAPYFHEVVLRLPMPARAFLERMRTEHDIVAGFELARLLPDRPNDVLVCATEMMSPLDIKQYVLAAQGVLAAVAAG